VNPLAFMFAAAFGIDFTSLIRAQTGSEAIVHAIFCIMWIKGYLIVTGEVKEREGVK